MARSFTILNIIVSLLGGSIIVFASYLFTLDELFSAISLMGFGLLFFGFGFIPLIINLAKKRKKKSLLASGIKIEADVIGLKTDRPLWLIIDTHFLFSAKAKTRPCQLNGTNLKVNIFGLVLKNTSLKPLPFTSILKT